MMMGWKKSMSKQPLKFSLKRRREMHKIYCKLNIIATNVLEAQGFGAGYDDELIKNWLLKFYRIMQKIHERGVLKWYNRLWWY